MFDCRKIVLNGELFFSGDCYIIFAAILNMLIWLLLYTSVLQSVSGAELETELTRLYASFLSSFPHR